MPMDNFWDNVVLLGGLEDSPGTFKSPGASNAILIGKDFSFDSDVPDIERDVMRGFMGTKETLPGSGPMRLKFKVELASSGSAIIAPAWSFLIKLAGTNAALVPAVMWMHTLVSSNFPTGSFVAYFGGTRMRVRGARVASIDIALNINGIPEATLEVIGIQHGPMVEDVAPAPVLADWKPPIVIKDENSADITFGCSLNAATGVISGGVKYPSDGLRISWKNNARYRPYLGGDSVPITGREITYETTLELTGAQRVEFEAAYQANTLTSLGFQIGNTPGSIVGIFMKSVERGRPQHKNDDGLIVYGCTGRARTVLGNDEIVLITR